LRIHNKTIAAVELQFVTIAFHHCQTTQNYP